MARTIEEFANNVGLLTGLGQYNLIGFLIQIGIQIDDLNANAQIIQQCHNLYLVSFFVDWLNFELAECLRWHLVVNEGLVQERVVPDLPRRYESQHQH